MRWEHVRAVRPATALSLSRLGDWNARFTFPVTDVLVERRHAPARTPWWVRTRGTDPDVVRLRLCPGAEQHTLFPGRRPGRFLGLLGGFALRLLLLGLFSGGLLCLRGLARGWRRGLRRGRFRCDARLVGWGHDRADHYEYGHEAEERVESNAPSGQCLARALAASNLDETEDAENETNEGRDDQGEYAEDVGGADRDAGDGETATLLCDRGAYSCTI